MFSFLNTGILIFMAAGVLPLLIYLFAKKKPKRVIFSSIKFIQQSSDSQRKKLNLKNILLLIIRMLIILLTILAISRPFLKISGLSNSTKHPATAISIIVDTSWSMQYLSDQTSSLSKAVEIINEISSMLNNKDIVSIVTLSREWNDLNAINRSTIPENLLSNINVSANPISMKEAFTISEQLLKEAQLSNREIYLLTDMQNQELPETTDYPVQVISLAPQSWLNISCVSASIDAKIINREFERAIDFKVKNHSEIERKDVLCRLVLNDKLTAEKFIDLKPYESKSDFFRIELGQSGWYNGYVEIQDELLTIDNRKYFSFPYNSRPKVAILTSQYDVPIVLKSVLEIYTASSESVKLLSPHNLNMDVLSQYDFLVVYEPGEIDRRVETLIRKYNQEGKGILFCSGNEMTTQVKEFYQSYLGLKILELEPDEKEISYINTHHPILALSTERALKEVKVRDFWRTDNTASNASVISVDNNTLFINPTPNWVLTADLSSLRNKLFLDSNWPVIMYKLFTDLSSKDIKNYNLELGSSFYAEKITLPDNNQVTPSGRDFTPSSPGIYKVSNKGTKSIYAVNIDNNESGYEKGDYSQLKGSEVIDKNWQKSIFRSRYGYELWKILLVIVLILFIIEMLLVKTEERKIS